MEECPICIEPMTTNDKDNKVLKLDCSHHFHYNCLINVKKNSCLLCREKILSNAECKQYNEERNKYCSCLGVVNPFFRVSQFKKNGKCRLCSRLKPDKDISIDIFFKNKIIN
jgi:hypothetical protein